MLPKAETTTVTFSEGGIDPGTFMVRLALDAGLLDRGNAHAGVLHGQQVALAIAVGLGADGDRSDVVDRLDAAVPPEHYRAVAEVIGYVLRLRRH